MIIKVQRLCRAGILLVLALLLGACGTEQVTPSAVATVANSTTTTGTGSGTATIAAANGETIKIGAVIPLTGRYASGGIQVEHGYKLAVDDINKAGGVDVGGRKLPLELTELDDESDPSKTVQRFETLNSSNSVAAYLGGFGSDLHAAAAAIAEKNKIPYLGVGFALLKIHQAGYKYLFSPFPKSPDVARSSFDVLDTLNPRPDKVAIFAETTDWGAELGELWRKEAQARGYQVVTDMQYTPGTKDFVTLISAAKNAGAQVLLTLPSGPDGITMMKQMKELAFTPQAAFIIRGADGATWSSNLGKDGDYVMQVSPWATTATFPGAQDLVQRYQAQYNSPPLANVASAYAAIQILADAITRAGSTDHQAIRDALAATDLKNSVIGPVKFNPDGTAAVAAVVTQYQDGKIVAIWPKEQAASAIIYPAKPFSER